MAIEDIWLENLRALVDSLAHVRKNGKRNLRSGYRAVADVSGVGEEYVYQLYNGKPNRNGIPPSVGKDTAAKIAKAFANGRPETWFDAPIGATWTNTHPPSAGAGSGGPPPPLAQQLIHPQLSIDPITIEWESILLSPLPARFRVRVPDDAMALDDPPSMRAGDWADFVPASEARPNQVVLLIDKHRNPYIRRYTLRRPGHWTATARHSGYAPMDSIEDGLQVLAVQVGASWG